jgi:predicted branched-subunit amino acid permease
MLDKEPNQSQGPVARDRLISVALAWTVLVVVGLLVWLIATELEPVGVAIALTPLLGAAVAFLWPQSQVALITSIALVGFATVLLLIGYTGVLFLPTLALLIAAAARESRRRQADAGVVGQNRAQSVP